METRNAKISSTSLGNEDHGILTVWVSLDYDGAGQGFGGYGLDDPLKDSEGNFIRRQGTVFGLEFIMRLMEAVGVMKWEDLPGTHVRVVCDHTKVHKIGHIMKDQWFDPKELAVEMGCA